MEKMIFFFIHLGVPILIIWALLAARHKSKVNFLATKIFQVAALLFLFQWGQYPIVGSYYLRYLLMAIILVTFLVGWKKWQSEWHLFPKTWFHTLLSIIVAILTCFILYLNYQAISGLNRKVNTTANLNFPLKNGTYYISSGGSTSIVNNHFRNYPNSQQFAIDINKINGTGKVSSNIFSNSNEKHFIYGQEVFCPCSGIVIKMQNNVQDNLTSSMDVDPEEGQGNYIKLNCDGLVVTMAHLKEGSVLVKTGDRVNEDQLVGKVGNSGFSQEPHLHIQAAIYNQDSILVGVPVTFNDRWLVRNDLVRS